MGVLGKAKQALIGPAPSHRLEHPDVADAGPFKKFATRLRPRSRHGASIRWITMLVVYLDKIEGRLAPPPTPLQDSLKKLQQLDLSGGRPDPFEDPDDGIPEVDHTGTFGETYGSPPPKLLAA